MNGQVYGSAATADYYYYLVATTFDRMHNALLKGGGPFAGVVTEVKNGRVYFANPATEQPAWAPGCASRWLAERPRRAIVSA